MTSLPLVPACDNFRINGKVFATLGVPDEGYGRVKLAPEQQQTFMRESPRVFYPCSGGWGRGGATHVHLASANQNVLRAALDCAFQNVAAKAKVKKKAIRPSPRSSDGR
jgi:hypothetical protein